MPATKVSQTLLAAQTIPAGLLNKANAVYSAWMDVRTYYRICVRWKITNGASAPGVVPWAIVQTSPDNGGTIYDEYPVAGDLVANQSSSGPIDVNDATMYVRIGFYGHTVNAITGEASVQAVTGV